MIPMPRIVVAEVVVPLSLRPDMRAIAPSARRDGIRPSLPTALPIDASSRRGRSDRLVGDTCPTRI